MKIALFRDTISSHTFVREDHKFKSDSDIQVSEFVDVDFTMIPGALEAAAKAEELRQQAKAVLKDFQIQKSTATVAEPSEVLEVERDSNFV